jgi:hypothetical protein
MPVVIQFENCYHSVLPAVFCGVEYGLLLWGKNMNDRCLKTKNMNDMCLRTKNMNDRCLRTKNMNDRCLRTKNMNDRCLRTKNSIKFVDLRGMEFVRNSGYYLTKN